MTTRRGFLRSGLLLGGALASAPMINRGRFALYGKQREYSRRTIELVGGSVVIDMLGLPTLDWSRLTRWEEDPHAFRNADYDKLERSGITVFHPAVDLNASDPYGATREWLRDWNVFIGNHPEYLVRVDNASDLVRAKRQGRVGIILGFQNADHFRIVQDVAYFHSQGQRVSQLTYNAANQLGSGCTEERDTGLTEFGVQVVREMNRLGMAVDVAHSGDYTTRDAIEVSRKPVLVTHSNCRALNPHPRCKTDEAIRLLAAKGGVFGVTGIRRFVRAEDPTTVEHVLDHFDHLMRLVGPEHIGVGSDTDLDGRDRPGTKIRMDIDGLNHPQRVFELTEGLVRRSYSDQNIRRILGGNFQRVLTEIWGSGSPNPPNSGTPVSLPAS